MSWPEAIAFIVLAVVFFAVLVSLMIGASMAFKADMRGRPHIKWLCDPPKMVIPSEVTP